VSRTGGWWQNVDVSDLRWRIVDAKDQVLGRLASHLAPLLMGKDKPTYAPSTERGDVVVVVNARHVAVTGKKMERKVYRWHTGYPGGLKERTLKEQLERQPERVLFKAVERMLPRNNLRKARMRKLRLFLDDKHTFVDQDLVPYVLPPRNYQNDTRRKTLQGGYRYVDEGPYETIGEIDAGASEDEGHASG